jgi:hypothetical protein
MVDSFNSDLLELLAVRCRNLVARQCLGGVASSSSQWPQPRGGMMLDSGVAGPDLVTVDQNRRSSSTVSFKPCP